MDVNTIDYDAVAEQMLEDPVVAKGAQRVFRLGSRSRPEALRNMPNERACREFGDHVAILFVTIVHRPMANEQEAMRVSIALYNVARNRGRS